MRGEGIDNILQFPDDGREDDEGNGNTSNAIHKELKFAQKVVNDLFADILAEYIATHNIQESIGIGLNSDTLKAMIDTAYTIGLTLNIVSNNFKNPSISDTEYKHAFITNVLYHKYPNPLTINPPNNN